MAGAFALGALMALGQAPLGLWPATLAGLGLLLRLGGGAAGLGQAAWLGLAAGTGYFALALSWIVEPFLVDAPRHGWMAPFAVVLLSTGLGLFWALAFGLGRRAPRRPVLGIALALVLAELARGYVLTGFPWAMIGHVWIGTPLDQFAALLGPGGLTLVTALAAAGLATLRPAGVGAGLAALAVIAGWGAWRLAQPGPAAPGAVIRLVQPAADQHLKWDPDRAQLYLDRLLTATRAAPLPDLTIWPETSLPYLMDGEGVLAGAIAEAGGGRPVLLGYQRVEGERGWNSLIVIAPDGSTVAGYDKHHLVPFGEYVPFGDLAYRLFGLRAFASQVGAGYTAGSGPQVIDLGPGLGPALPLICYEAVFPQGLRGTDRPAWLVQITNDAWFGRLTGPWQHLAQARLRAVEQGLPLARSANTGVTAMIDARGRIVADLPFGEPGHLDAPLPGALPATPYSRWGEWPLLLLLAGLALPLLFGRRQGTA